MKLTFALFLRALFLLSVMAFAGIGLGPDEAQYWTWSQKLSLGYYSKPPGIAWQIWIGTQIFGNTELGVRFFALVLGTLLVYSVYGLGRTCGLSKEKALLCSLALAFSPLGMMGSFLAITDGGMALCWTLSCWIVADALKKGVTFHYTLLGLTLLVGALFKWPVYLFWPLLALSMLYFKQLRSRSVWIGVALSLLGLIPSFIWNASHDFVTFRHVLATIVGQKGEVGTTTLASGNFFSFLGAQTALVFPLFFVLIGGGIVKIFRQKGDSPALRFISLQTIGILSLYLFFSTFQKMQGNWCAFIYPPAFVCLSALSPSLFQKGTRLAIALSLILMIFAFSIPNLEEKGYGIAYRLNPFRHNVGWKALNTSLKKSGYDPDKHFLFSDKYQTVSILSFYGPGQKRAYFFNLFHLRYNQFSFWPGMEEQQVGKSGYFVATENANTMADQVKEYERLLSPYFKRVRYLGEFPLFSVQHQPVKTAIVFYTEEYLGGLPSLSPTSPLKY